MKSIKTVFKRCIFSDKGQQVYKRQEHITESQFGLLKDVRNFPELKRKGRKKSFIDLLIESISHNIKIIHKHRDLNKISEI